jgi:hypothetical protein
VNMTAEQRPSKQCPCVATTTRAGWALLTRPH